MPARKSTSKKRASGGGGGGASSRGVSSDAVQKILRQAKPQEDTGEMRGATRGGAATAIPDFCRNYRSTIRPILMAIIGALKLFKKQWAETLAQVVAFLDMVCGG